MPIPLRNDFTSLSIMYNSPQEYHLSYRPPPELWLDLHSDSTVLKGEHLRTTRVACLPKVDIDVIDISSLKWSVPFPSALGAACFCQCQFTLAGSIGWIFRVFWWDIKQLLFAAGQ